jgi:hypothetical protein
VGCERTAVVRDAFRARGHDAWSCDIEPTEGDPSWHVQGDVLDLLGSSWDLMIAFPPCQKLSNVGNKYNAGTSERAEALNFVQTLMDADVPRIAIENPVGAINSAIRKPDQIIEPWMFGAPYHKRTCLWLKNLPLLSPCRPVLPVAHLVHGGTGQVAALPRSYTSARTRERTFSGIAESMADQWGGCPVRFCRSCRKPFTGRADARTCSSRCRQRLSRIRRAKCDSS